VMRHRIETIPFFQSSYDKNVSGSIRKEHEKILVHTGQHYYPKLSDIFFSSANPPTKFSLEFGSESHGKQTSAILEKAENALMKEMPDLVLEYDDTNSTLADRFPISGVGTMRLFLQGPFRVNILSDIQGLFSQR